MASTPPFTLDPATRAKARPVLSTGLLLALVAYLAVNAGIAGLTVEGANLAHGADVGNWYRPAIGLLKYGEFVDPKDPSTYLTLRPPLYPLMIAGLLALTGSIWNIVVVQVAMLFLTGLVARTIAERLLPGYGMLVLVLTIFNPNALGAAHLVQAETLYALVMTMLFWAVVVFCQTNTWRAGLVTGALFGISLMVRNPLLALLPLWPLVMMVLAMIARGRAVWKRALVIGIAASALAFAITVPWQAYNKRAGEGFGFTTQYHKFWFLKIELIFLEHCRTGEKFEIGRDRLAGERNEFSKSTAGFDSLSERDRWRRLTDFQLQQMRRYSMRDYVCALLPSWAMMYGLPGTTSFSMLFNLVETDNLVLLRRRQFAEYLSNVSWNSIAITLTSIVILLLVRLLNLVGVLAMIRRRAWMPLLLISGASAYLAAVILFAGTARYRLPVDPMLFLLAAYGLAEIRERWLGRATRPKMDTASADRPGNQPTAG